jgi:hypothetical protein
MLDTNRQLPDSMTAEERMDELSTLLFRGVSRLWEQSVSKSADLSAKSHLVLGYSADQSVHTNPSNKPTQAK